MAKVVVHDRDILSTKFENSRNRPLNQVKLNALATNKALKATEPGQARSEIVKQLQPL